MEKVKVEKIRPQYHGEECPVCKGDGELPNPRDPLNMKECHGCKGKGWIFVPNFPKEKTSGGVGVRI